MNLNIVIPDDAAQILNSCASSEGEDLAGFAGHVLRRLAQGEQIVLRTPTSPKDVNPMSGEVEQSRPIDTTARTQEARALLDRFAREQGVGKFVLDPPGTRDRWPEDGPVEKMVHGILQQRDTEPQRAFP